MYSVEVKSRFAALPLDDEDAPSEATKICSPAKVIKEISDTKDNLNDNNRGRGAKVNTRGTRGSNRGSMRGGKIENFNNGNNDLPRGRGRGRGPRPGGMRMDRHSGSDKTGVKPTIKKDGHGTGNWGTVQDELDATVENDQNQEDNTENENPCVPPEPQVKTFSEYKASKNKEVKHVPPSMRKPNDGKDVFKNMIVKNPSLKKTQVIEEESKENTKHVAIEDTLTYECVNEIRQNDSYNYNRNSDSRGGSRGRGGRGAGRGRGFNDGRGGKNNTSRLPVPSIKNAEEFPALA